MEDKMKKQFITLKTNIKIEMIFSFQNKEQQLWKCELRAIPIDWNESDFIKNLIENAFHSDIESTKDLVKISMCISGDKFYDKAPCIKQMLQRNGKYYFQPDQRDKVENAIIKNSVIASETKPFSELRIN